MFVVIRDANGVKEKEGKPEEEPECEFQRLVDSYLRPQHSSVVKEEEEEHRSAVLSNLATKHLWPTPPISD